jgi:uncharacterized membrane protein
MKRLQETIPELFEEGEEERADYYIDKIRDSYATTNKLFMSLMFLQTLSLITYFLFIFKKIDKVSIFGLETSDPVFVKTWFLIIPSILFLINSYVGYLRVYQKEGIEWLLVKYRNKEFKSNIFRLTFPANHILGMEILQLQESKFIKIINYIPVLIIAFISVLGPITLTFIGYREQFESTELSLYLKLSIVISFTCYLCGIFVMKQSQKI